MRRLGVGVAAAICAAESLAACGGGATGGPRAGFRSFDITATLTVTPAAGQGGSWPDFPTTQVFTLVWDSGSGVAFVGGGGDFSATAVTAVADGTFASQRWLADVPFSVSCTGIGGVRYDQVTFSLDGDRVRGTASGTATYTTGDVISEAPVTATLAGAPDVTPPTLTVPPSPVDPLAPLSFLASEPLPPDAKASLRTPSGAVVELLPDYVDDGRRVVRGFSKPDVVLRAGETYTLATASVLDFAGLTSASPAAFSTRAAPPLVAEDGFESVMGTTFAGAGVLRGGPLMPVAGQTSLLLNTGFGGGFGFLPYDLGSSLAVRLAVAPGDTVVRFDGLLIAPDPIDAAAFVGALRVGSEGGAVSASMNVAATGFVKQTLPSLGDVFVSPVQTVELPLPADAAPEVTFEIEGVTFACGLPPSPTVLVLDNLRVE